MNDHRAGLSKLIRAKLETFSTTIVPLNSRRSMREHCCFILPSTYAHENSSIDGADVSPRCSTLMEQKVRYEAYREVAASYLICEQDNAIPAGYQVRSNNEETLACAHLLIRSMPLTGDHGYTSWNHPYRTARC